MEDDKKVIKLKLNFVIAIILASILIVSIVVVALLKVNSTKNKKLESNTEKHNINQNTDITTTEKNTNNEDTIKIRYAYTYSVPTADDLNEMQNEEYGENYINILEIKLEGNRLEEISQILENVSFEKADLSAYKGTNLAIGVGGEFEVTINNDMTLLLDSRWSLYTKGEESYIIETPEELYDKIASIVQEEVNKNAKNYSSKKITIIPRNAESEDVVITDEKHIDMLIESFKYSKVNIHEEEMEDETETYMIDLNNGVQVYLFHASTIGCVIDNTEKYYVAFMTDFEDIVSTLYENYIEGRTNTIKADKILVKYQGKEYKVEDKNKVGKIIDHLIMECQYNDYDFLKDYSEEQFGDEDIIIQLENSKIIIPGNISIGNRYYINEYGKVYMISGLSELETYFKELVGYRVN